MRVLVLTISDRASQGVYEDRSGPVIESVLREADSGMSIERLIVSDDAAEILGAFRAHGDADFIVTTGGTGLSSRDITPEVTASYCDRLIPGIAEYLRTESCKTTLNAMLSRGVAGVKGNTIIINVPGSPKAGAFCARLLAPILTHALDMVNGSGHGK
jgi:molybdopterin adenylyltransferase